MFVIIVFWLYVVIGRRDFFLFRATFASFHTHASLLTSFFCCFLFLIRHFSSI